MAQSEASYAGSELRRQFVDELIVQFDCDLGLIEREQRPLTPAEADGFFTALTAIAVGSYSLAGAALDVARGGRHHTAAIEEAPDEVTLVGIRQAFEEWKAWRYVCRRQSEPVGARRSRDGRFIDGTQLPAPSHHRLRFAAEPAPHGPCSRGGPSRPRSTS